MSEDGSRFTAWMRSGDGSETLAIPAATVILLRDATDGLETLMLRRNSKLAFGGMWVFPGGRVDAADHVDAADAFDAARRAAVREAMEESDLAVAIDEMVALSHWTPPPQTPKRFATWFFVAPAPAGAVTIDDGEIHEHRWVSPTDALALRDAGEIELAPPTFVTLHTLAGAATVADALAIAAGREPDVFVTRIAVTDEGLVTLWAGDAGYESGDAAIAGPRHRLVMADGGWRYERDG
ncbi:MAG: NUDIX hydrolase [Acidimicrobiia bacterium]